MTNRELGDLGEGLAEQMLLAKHCTLLERNWQVRDGEVDLVVLDNATVVFVEVKTRVTDSYGSPEEAVDEAKQRKLLMLGQLYMSRASHDLADLAWRIDVVAVELNQSHRVRHIRHFKDAVRSDV